MENKCGTNIDQTIEYYEKNASAFIESTINADVSELYRPFEELITPGCRILDLGCGSGRDSKYYVGKGFDVVALDSSPAMCAQTRALVHIASNQLISNKNDGRNGLGGNSYTNNFYSNTNAIQIQQGTTNSTQTQAVPHLLDAEQVDELIRMIKKYDAVLDNEYGADEADKVREAANELEAAVKDGSSPKRAMGILSYIRDLSVNAGGGLIAAGILQLITTIMR